MASVLGEQIIKQTDEAVGLWAPIIENEQAVPFGYNRVIVIADESNSGVIVLADNKYVDAATASRKGYWGLDPGEAIIIDAEIDNTIDLNEWWMSGTVSGDKVRFVATLGKTFTIRRLAT